MEIKTSQLDTMKKVELDSEIHEELRHKFSGYRRDINGALNEFKTASGLVISLSSTENGSGDVRSIITKTVIHIANCYESGTLDGMNAARMETVSLFEVPNLSTAEIKKVLHKAETEFQGIKGIDTGGLVIIDARDENEFKINVLNLKNNTRHEAVFDKRSY